MGVKGYCYMLKCYFGETHSNIFKNYDHLMIDGNCIIHDVVANLNHHISPSIEEITSATIQRFKELIQRAEYKKIFIVLDGIPPIPKQFCQKERRKNDLSISSLILPNTKLMNCLESSLITNFQGTFVEIVGTRIDGEGEQKIFNKLRSLSSDIKKKVHILSVDSDTIILSQLFVKKYNFDIFVESTMFDLIFDIKKLNHQLMKYNITEDDQLLLFCMICGNDFFPRLEEIKRLELKNFDVLKLFLPDFKIFTILATKSCLNNCSLDQIENYVNTWQWFLHYFTLNEFISCSPYIYENAPCCFCIKKHVLNTSSFINRFFKRCSERKEEHLSFVLNNVTLAHRLC